ncbi:MAG TPA: M15 family metallopeptidase [Candidatus Limiplasma stercoravium]|nr:M15 family metallopeptidase [Candidatus Limiplasma stercoravium]
MLLEKLISVVAASATLLGGSMDAALPDKDIDGTLFLINRQNAVSELYVPPVREVVANGMNQSMRDDAATALEEMFEAAKEDGVRLSVVSGYRSYSKQATIYQRKVATTGSEEKADELVARAGTSEHQLGLAMDVSKNGSSSLTERFAETEEGQWVYQNAHRFGFIVRYLEGYEEITGYSYEPWHVRYVGREHAAAIYASQEPMETYMTDYKLQVYDFLIHQDTNEVLP